MLVSDNAGWHVGTNLITPHPPTSLPINFRNKFQLPNSVNGLFAQVVDSPRLSGTRWYMLASPDVAPVFEVVFLNGVQEPFIDQMNTWTIDGVEMKVRLDYGVGAVDYRGAITNAGA